MKKNKRKTQGCNFTINGIEELRSNVANSDFGNGTENAISIDEIAKSNSEIYKNLVTNNPISESPDRSGGPFPGKPDTSGGPYDG